MSEDGQLTKEQFEQMRQTAQKTVQEVTEWAMNEPYPSAEDLYEDIWV